MRSKAATFSPQKKRARVILATAFLVLAAGACFTLASHAQQVYRIVGPDGKVSFSDLPPLQVSNAKVADSSPAASLAAAPRLPFELRQVASQYPVVLYTADNCPPCTAARSLLTTRGVPYVEKTVTRGEDLQAFERLSGGTTLPMATIGSQQLKGYAASEWTQYLNAAGYPAASRLPLNYRPPAPTPMVAVTPAQATVPAGGQAPGAARQAEPSVQPRTSPSGIQF